MSSQIPNANDTAPEPKGKRTKGGHTGLLIAAVTLTALITMGLTWLLMNILQHKQEANTTFTQVVAMDDNTDDPAVWGKNFPTQYDMYLKTADQQRTTYGGSEALPHTPTDADPRTVVAASKLEKDPRLVTMWSGYAFSVDYREKRGHAYMLIDQADTRRVQEFKQPGACINCHASTYVAMKKLGNGDLNAGFAKINHMTYAEAAKQVKHPVACIDCHDPKTMALRVTKPAFMTGITALKASQGIKSYDVNRDATTQEMRTYVCAQCHVEYYFKDKKDLTFPWTKGVNIDNEFAYYQEAGFTDWTHKLTGAPMLKAQHPEFETWNQGVHSKAGVGCADCHMPYTRVGAAKVSDHQVRSPMLNINRACQVCHNASEEDIKSRVESIQKRYIDTRSSALDALSQLVTDIVEAKNGGVAADRVDAARSWQRKASYYIDYSLSENSNGFHAPEESIRIMQTATDACRQGELALIGKAAMEPTSKLAFTKAAAAAATASAGASATPAPSATASTQPATTPAASTATSAATAPATSAGN